MFIIRQMNQQREEMTLHDKPLTKRDGFSNFLFFIIQRLACDASELLSYGYDMSSCYVMLHAAKGTIMENIKSLDEKELKNNELIEIGSLIQLENKKGPVVKVTQPIEPFRSSLQSATELDIQNFVDQNLGALSFLTMEKSLHSAVMWSENCRQRIKGSTTNMMFFLSNIESFLWMLSETKLAEESLDTPKDIEHIMTLVDAYRLVLQELLSTLQGTSKDMVKDKHDDSNDDNNGVDMITNLHCLEILVVWVSYCLVFNSISRKYPDIMRGFGVALTFSDLQHLVLHNKMHRDVVERVVIFLHKNHVPNLDIFSLRSHDSWNSATFKMGEKYSESHLLSIYEKQKKDEITRVNQHWEKVEQKKRLARRLRTELGNLENDLDKAEEKERKARVVYNCSSRRYGYEYDEYQGCAESTKKVRSQIESKREEIKVAEISPDPVIQPLPKSRGKTMKVLFFLHMPGDFRDLARLTFTSQQLLLPSPWITDVGGVDGTDSYDVFASVKQATQLTNQWSTHYNEYQNLYNGANPNNPQGRNGSVGLRMEENSDLKPLNPSHIDNLRLPSDGVWYPDQRGIKMSWTGGTQKWDKHSSGCQFNPFSIAAILTGTVEEYFLFKAITRNILLTVYNLMLLY
jgi:hypothetical protein